MARIGIIFTAFQIEEYVEQSLDPWISARTAQLMGNEWFIVAVSIPFKGFDIGRLDRTVRLTQQAHQAANIDHVITGTEPMLETEARGAALNWLKDKKVDMVWQVDADELYTTRQILDILSFVDENPFVTWFKLSFKNMVFTPDSYLEDPFVPARIHRIRARGTEATSFRDDNNLWYGDATDTCHPSMIVPQRIAWIKHMTWLSDDRSRKKIAYQETRGWECSFRWDNGLFFNEMYYFKRGLPVPKIVRE